MIRKGLLSALVVVLSTGAVPAAAQFLAADLIYLPAVTHTNGEDESRWRSDVFLTNVEEDVDIDIAMVYLPTGLASNTEAFSDRSTWLGGRDSDEFGFVNTELADIPPGGTVVLRDLVGDRHAHRRLEAGSLLVVVLIGDRELLDQRVGEVERPHRRQRHGRSHRP